MNDVIADIKFSNDATQLYLLATESKAENSDAFRTKLYALLESTLHAHTEHLKERVEGLKVDITPVKESQEAGMSLAEAERVYVYATAYNNAATDVLAMLSEDK